MEKGENRIGKSFEYPKNLGRCLFYFLGLLILIIYHMQYDLSYGDVVNVYGPVLQRGSEYFPVDGNVFQGIYNFTVFHYLNWSSRSLIEIILIVVGALPAICWHILDILSVLLIGYCMEQLVCIQDKRIKYFSIFSVLMMYQVITMRSAGWIATTVNYSWVAAAGLYMYLVMQRLRGGGTLGKHHTYWRCLQRCLR